MKKFCISLILIIIIILTTACAEGSGNSDKSEYLRIHIRANSNLKSDQDVKYAVKEAVVSYVTPIVSECLSKEEAVKKIAEVKPTLKFLCDSVLKNNGKDYYSAIEVRNEMFPTRVYEGLTLESGYYDAMIIELGEGKGDNWWCVVYPPFCFTDVKDVKYKSKIIEIIKKWRNNE